MVRPGNDHDGGGPSLLEDALGREAFADALFRAATARVPLTAAALSSAAVDLESLQAALDAAAASVGYDAPPLDWINPIPELVKALPPGMCRELLALPIGRDPGSGVVDLAVVDPSDPHPALEIAFWLEASVRSVRASVAAVRAALQAAANQPVPAGGSFASEPTDPVEPVASSGVPTQRGPFSLPRGAEGDETPDGPRDDEEEDEETVPTRRGR